ncbi:uncharacterized protein [Haliotis asinina]|uniref:uncharacterized protein n=1 Tax=Haliotis asinina TaxID=109174 RepID=UPI0035318E96
MGNNGSRAMKRAVLSGCKAVQRFFRIKWVKLKGIFVERKKMKATLVVTDATDDLDQDDAGSDLVGTNMVMTITFESPDELEWIRRQFKASFKSSRGSRDEFLNQLIQLHYTYGVDVEQIYTKADKADIAASTLGMISNTLGFVGFGMAFVTFGSSLIISLTGAALGIVSGCVSFAIHRKRMAAKKEMWKKIKARTDKFNQENEKLLHILSEAEYYGIVTSGVSGMIKGPIKVGLQACEVAQIDEVLPIVGDVGSTAAKASKSVVKGLSTFGEVLFYGGFVFNVVSTAVDTYTIAKNSKRLIKGELCDQAQAHYDIAHAYEQFRDSGASSLECLL